jgi:lipoprotein NlpI
MKKVFAFVLVASMITLAACSQKSETTTGADTTSVDTTAVVADTAAVDTAAVADTTKK